MTKKRSALLLLNESLTFSRQPREEAALAAC